MATNLVHHAAVRVASALGLYPSSDTRPPLQHVLHNWTGLSSLEIGENVVGDFRLPLRLPMDNF